MAANPNELLLTYDDSFWEFEEFSKSDLKEMEKAKSASEAEVDRSLWNATWDDDQESDSAFVVQLRYPFILLTR